MGIVNNYVQNQSLQPNTGGFTPFGPNNPEPAPTPPRLSGIFGPDSFFSMFPDAPRQPERMTADMTMYVDPITGMQRSGSSTMGSYRQRLKDYLDANPEAASSYYEKNPLQNTSGSITDIFRTPEQQPIYTYGPGGPAGTEAAAGLNNQQPNNGVNMNYGDSRALDPRLEGQGTKETLADPYLQALYFGTNNQPGIINQLQNAASERIGSQVPLLGTAYQQTAGLSDLEALGLGRLKSGIGSYEPFLQRAEDFYGKGLQDIGGGITEAEGLVRNTLGSYDPSMGQKFFNPYEDQVVQQTIADATKGFDMQEAQQRASDIENYGSSAFGSRGRLTAQERQDAFGRGLASQISGIRGQGYETSQNKANQEFNRQLAARRSAAGDLSNLAGVRGGSQINYGEQLANLGSNYSSMGRSEVQDLLTGGALPRGIFDTMYGRNFTGDVASNKARFDQQIMQRQDPLNVLSGIAQVLPQYQGSKTSIDSVYGMAPDPSALGLGSALNAYSALYGSMGPYGSANPRNA